MQPAFSQAPTQTLPTGSVPALTQKLPASSQSSLVSTVTTGLLVQPPVQASPQSGASAMVHMGPDSFGSGRQTLTQILPFFPLQDVTGLPTDLCISSSSTQTSGVPPNSMNVTQLTQAQIGAPQQSIPNKVMAWSGVLEWQEVRAELWKRKKKDS